ncbi:MAG: endolytic transglycosylase MltG [Ruminococcaceae bacterium]|nr:endolytic transglycosylase MltG [Oscillospiraceae bacterium]
MSDERRYDTARYDSQRVRDVQRRESALRQQPSGGSGARQLTSAEREALRRKGRRRRGFLRFVLWVIFVGASSLVLSGVGWLLANDFAALNKTPLTATITVTKDDDLATVADKLEEQGLIEYKWFFKLFGKVAHAESKIGIGTYELNTEMDYNALINAMRNKNAALDSATVRVAIPEGYTVKQIIELLVKYGVNTEEALTEAAKNYDYQYSFLDPAKKGDIRRLEGYLFPDTYEFYVGGNAANAIGKLLSNFNSKITPEMNEKINSSGRTLEEVIIVASLIEKETDGHDRANIASVIYNRLNNVGETAHLLQIDASIIYGLGSKYTGKLTQDDLDYDTPYNLHLHGGLPPTPIANPGLASIEAALEPAETGYYFYALGKDGSHHFFDTYNKFLNFVNSDQYAG